MLKERSLSRALLEAFVIVSSILLAFAIDAAWDGVQVRRAERELVAAVLDEVRLNRAALQQAEQANSAQLAGVDAFFRATPDDLLLIPADSSRAVLRSLILVPAFVPLNEAALTLTRSPPSSSDGIDVRREVAGWLRLSERLVEQRASLEDRAQRVDQLVTKHAAAGRSAGLGFLPSMVMRSGPEALVSVWSDDTLAAALIEKGTAQTVFGLLIERALPVLDSVETALSSSQTR
jgi:hypothetical protein